MVIQSQEGLITSLLAKLGSHKVSKKSIPNLRKQKHKTKQSKLLYPNSTISHIINLTKKITAKPHKTISCPEFLHRNTRKENYYLDQAAHPYKDESFTIYTIYVKKQQAEIQKRWSLYQQKVQKEKKDT